MNRYLFSALTPLLLLCTFFIGCAKSPSDKHHDDVDYYTCTMHPSVHSHDPGKCPICSMDLVPVMKKGQAGSAGTSTVSASSDLMGAEHPTEFTVPVDRQQFIGVTYAAVKRIPLQSALRSVGLVAVDKQRHWDYVARLDGYIHELKVFAPGETVEKGQTLMDIYSPDLVATENEFIDLLRMRDRANESGSTAIKENTEHLLSSARQRLSQWNLSEEQIGVLESSRKASAFLSLASPFRGVVETVGVDQGRRVAAGDHLVDIADLTHLWIWAEFYQDELASIKTGTSVSITSSTYPGKTMTGTVSIIDPFMNETKRTGRVRIDVENPDLMLRPDMYVDVDVTIDRGEGLAIPLTAVLPTGKHNVVFVDKGNGRLLPQFVELGGKFGDFYQIISGVAENDRVVTSANFLIDAESKVQGALKSW